MFHGNFDSHHPTQYSVDILDLHLYHESDEILEPESQFEVLPHEINLEVIYDQEPGSPLPELETVEDEVDIQQFTSDSSHHPAPLFSEVHDEISYAPAHSSIEKN